MKENVLVSKLICKECNEIVFVVCDKEPAGDPHNRAQMPSILWTCPHCNCPNTSPGAGGSHCDSRPDDAVKGKVINPPIDRV